MHTIKWLWNYKGPIREALEFVLFLTFWTNIALVIIVSYWFFLSSFINFVLLIIVALRNPSSLKDMDPDCGL